MFDRDKFEETLSELANHYEDSAPTVSNFCNEIFGMRDSLVTLQDLVLLQQFSEEKFEPNLAANMIYHHQESLGRSTVGHIGF
tara:strand:- start:2886 stop:3134 length:249 start_codon:yes stop_codon:yes gene_type:complete